MRYAAVFLLMIVGMGAASARADDYSIDAPEVQAGEVSVSANLNYSADRHPALDHYFSQVYGAQWGVNGIWSTQLSGVVEKTSAEKDKLTNVKWSNIIAPFRPGQYWVDVGLGLNFEHNIESHDPDRAEAKLLVEKDYGPWRNTLNADLSANLGADVSGGLEAGYAWRTKYHVSDAFEPGVEYYSSLGRLADFDKTRRQDNVAGPVIQGDFGSFSYDAGALFGVSRAAHDMTGKLNLEYRF